MDNSAEDFWVQYFDGTTWHTVATYARGTDFDNRLHYAAKINIFETDYTFPSGMKLLFMCDASGNIDYIYLDKIRVSASTQTDPDTWLVVVPSDYKGEVGMDEIAETGIRIYPNPATNVLNIDCEDAGAEIMIYDLQGKVVKEISCNISHQTIDISYLDNGMYILRIVSEEGSRFEKQIKR
nr:T9SS type A sorting domain-containing protein [Bacteroidota bacterium]